MGGIIWKHLTVYIWVPLWVNLWVRSWNWVTISACFGFPGSSAGKESICNAGDPGSIPGLGRCPGEGIGYPLQDSWASLVAQTVKNPPAMWQIWVRYLGQEDPLEGGLATHSSILAWRIPTDRRAWQLQLQSMGSHRVGHDWAANTDTHTQTHRHTHRHTHTHTHISMFMWNNECVGARMWMYVFLNLSLRANQCVFS